MKKSYNFKNLSYRLKKNINPLFVLLLIALFVMEALVIRRSVTIALAANSKSGDVTFDPKVKVNFSSYQDVINRIQGADTFQPDPPPAANPFGSQ